MQSPNIADAEWFRRSETQSVFHCLNRDGFEVRIAGGAIRNALLGQPVFEVDFATTATPLDTIRLAADAGVKSVPTGIQHGTITLVVNKTAFEVTTLRRDIETDGRHATVVFGTDWKEDALRRDFTINAFFADRSGAVHDPLGGLRDLEAGRVRFIGDAQLRIREDYLRILRFFRFSAEYAQGGFDEEGVLASIRERHGLERLSKERIRAELLRIVIARRASAAIEIMDETGLLALLLGGVARRARFERLRSMEDALSLPLSPVRRLGALALFVEEDAERLADRLRLSSEESTLLYALAAHSPKIEDRIGRDVLERFLYRFGKNLMLDRVLLAWASLPSYPHRIVDVNLLRWILDWEKPHFPVTGSDLISLGWTPGPKVGEKLRELEAFWIEQNFRPSRKALLQRIDTAGGVTARAPSR